MTHTFITKNRVQGFDNPLIVPITPTAGSTVLVLSLVTDGGVARIGGTPTYHGTNMTFICGAQAGETCVEMWYILNPDVGAFSISIPNTQPEELWAVPVVFKAQAGYASELDVSNAADGLGVNPSLSVTTTVDGDAIVNGMGSGYFNIPTANSDILLYSVDDGTHSDNHQYALDAVAGPRTLSWTQSGDDWCMAVVAFKEVSTGPTGHPWYYERKQ